MTHRGMIRWANVALFWLVAIGFAANFLKVAFLLPGSFGQDAHAYWAALQGGPLYDGRPGELDAFLYSPIFAQALAPLGALPFGAFYALWLGLGVAAVVWLVKPLPVRWAVPLGVLTVEDLIIGNIYVFLAVMVALGVRHPAAWAFGVLTKVTPGVGIVWLLARRDWRGAAIAIAVTGAMVAVSWVLAPADWAGWLHLLTSNRDGDPTFLPRCVLALALAIVAARPGRTWLLAAAVVAATPVFSASACFVPLLAIPHLLAFDRSQVAAADPVGRLDRARPREVATSPTR